MNLIPRLIMAAAMLPVSSALFAQQSGVIDYEVTQRIDPARMARFQGGNGEGGDIPDVITLQQHFTFNNGIGKLTTDRPDFGGQGFGGRRNPDGDTARQRWQRPDGAGGQGRPGGGPGGFGGFGPQRGFGGGQLVDLKNKKYETLFSTSGDEKKTYLSEEDYVIAPNAERSDKTKKIAGYTCKKATVKLKDETYTVWYTTELPFSYSPINGLLPDSNAVVLSAESSSRSFTAKKISLKPVTDTDLSVPADAQKVTPEEMRDIRRAEMEKLRKRQQQN